MIVCRFIDGWIGAKRAVGGASGTCSARCSGKTGTMLVALQSGLHSRFQLRVVRRLLPQNEKKIDLWNAAFFKNDCCTLTYMTDPPKLGGKSVAARLSKIKSDPESTFRRHRLAVVTRKLRRDANFDRHMWSSKTSIWLHW